MDEFVLHGKVVKGYQLASGLGKLPNVPFTRTVGLQMPYFVQAGIPGIGEMHIGTINMSIAPRKLKILKPDYEVMCEWFPKITETFWIMDDVKIIYGEKEYNGFVYYPTPSDIHIVRDEIIELLTVKIPGVKYGDDISISLPAEKYEVTEEKE